MKKLALPLLVAGALLHTGTAAAQDVRIEHMEPPFWWAGMQHKKVQLMVHGKRIADLSQAAASEIGMMHRGVARARIEVLDEDARNPG